MRRKKWKISFSTPTNYVTRRGAKKTVADDNDVTVFTTLYETILQEGEALDPMASKPDGKQGRATNCGLPLIFCIAWASSTARLSCALSMVPTSYSQTTSANTLCACPRPSKKSLAAFARFMTPTIFSIICSCLCRLQTQRHGMLGVLRCGFAGEQICHATCGWIAIIYHAVKFILTITWPVRLSTTLIDSTVPLI